MKRVFKVIFGLNLVSLVYLLRLRPRQFLQACSRAFTAATKASSSRLREIPEISLDEILGDRKPVIRMPVMRYEDGMLPSTQAMALISILVAEHPTEVLEIGTYMGYTTKLMAENLEDAIIHTVDLPEDYVPEHDTTSGTPKDDFHLIRRRIVGREYKGIPCASRIRQHFGDTATWNFREAGHPGFFFIDGSHTYEYCKIDTAKCFDLSGSSGVFLWHDCDEAHPGVVKCILEWREMGRDVRRIAGTPLAYWKGSSNMPSGGNLGTPSIKV